jgi:hypothetical protein
VLREVAPILALMPFDDVQSQRGRPAKAVCAETRPFDWVEVLAKPGLLDESGWARPSSYQDRPIAMNAESQFH